MAFAKSDDGKAEKGFVRRRPRKKVCPFCSNKEVIDYKDGSKLKKYVNAEGGKIVPRRVSGCCAKHQRELTIAIKRARHIAVLPFSAR